MKWYLWVLIGVLEKQFRKVVDSIVFLVKNNRVILSFVLLLFGVVNCVINFISIASSYFKRVKNFVFKSYQVKITSWGHSSKHRKSFFHKVYTNDKLSHCSNSPSWYPHLRIFRWLSKPGLFTRIGTIFLFICFWGILIIPTWGEAIPTFSTNSSHIPDYSTMFGKYQVVESAPNNDKVQAYLLRLGDMENCKIEGSWDNGSLSYGRYCFKRSTLLAGIKELNLYPQAEPQELENFLGDRETQEKIILAWIEKDPNILKQQFYTSIVVRGLGLPNL